MDPYSSGEELLTKTRKPYTITKQRERWTEEEHNKFLEALKLYGRAWQRIEEHIGTKTAVQIRSHAQKFFTKLEKEALVKGVPIRQALDIEIPPPRPKRKPSNPYPRKTGAPTPTVQVTAKDGKVETSVSSLSSGKRILDLEKEQLSVDPGGAKKLGNANNDNVEGNCTETFSLYAEATCPSRTSANEIPVLTAVAILNSHASREFVPVVDEVINQDETDGSYITVEPKGGKKLDKLEPEQTNATSNSSNFRNSPHPPENLVQGLNRDKLGHNGKFGASRNCPRHVPVHIVDGNLGVGAKNVSAEASCGESTIHQMGKVLERPNLFANLESSPSSTPHNNASSSSIDQTFHPFHPLFTSDNQDGYKSFVHISSTFSSLIISSLLQNPAAHAAASFAASFWPSANMEAPSGDISARQLNASAPSMAAIAAATVAAATAWWAAHGLLPVCAPFHTGFTSATPFAFASPIDNNHTRVINRGEHTHASEGDNLDKKHSEALFEDSPSKSPTLSISEDSEESKYKKLNTGSTPAADNEKTEVEDHGSTKTKIKKLVDRSSCGSNTTSSSEIETDALEKEDKPKEESKEPDASHTSSDSTNRRNRSSISPSDSWKEVSEEGRLAFQALFSREVLPQSFSPPHEQLMNSTKKDRLNVLEINEGTSRLDLNSNLWEAYSSKQSVEKCTNSFAFLREENNGEEGLLTMGLGQAKLAINRTGFKPYKRCSIEAKENRMVSTGSQNDDKCPKRMRLDGKAST